MSSSRSFLEAKVIPKPGGTIEYQSEAKSLKASLGKTLLVAPYCGCNPKFSEADDSRMDARFMKKPCMEHRMRYQQ
jgi:hypothetical protein